MQKSSHLGHGCWKENFEVHPKMQHQANFWWIHFFSIIARNKYIQKNQINIFAWWSELTSAQEKLSFHCILSWIWKKFLLRNLSQQKWTQMKCCVFVVISYKANKNPQQQTISVRCLSCLEIFPCTPYWRARTILNRSGDMNWKLVRSSHYSTCIHDTEGKVRSPVPWRARAENR